MSIMASGVALSRSSALTLVQELGLVQVQVQAPVCTPLARQG